VRAAQPQGTFAPAARGYHSFTALGQRLYAIGGKAGDASLLRGRDAVSTYDPASNMWLSPSAVGGARFSPRSSHRAVAHGDRIFVFGGVGAPRGAAAAAAANATGGTAEEEEETDVAAYRRVNDLYSLCVHPATGRLAWQCLDAGDGGTRPPGRSAHASAIVGGAMFVLCGYAATYSSVCWRLELSRLPPPPHGAAGAAGATVMPRNARGGAAPRTPLRGLLGSMRAGPSAPAVAAAPAGALATPASAAAPRTGRVTAGLMVQRATAAANPRTAAGKPVVLTYEAVAAVRTAAVDLSATAPAEEDSVASISIPVLHAARPGGRVAAAAQAAAQAAQAAQAATAPRARRQAAAAPQPPQPEGEPSAWHTRKRGRYAAEPAAAEAGSSQPFPSPPPAKRHAPVAGDDRDAAAPAPAGALLSPHRRHAAGATLQERVSQLEEDLRVRTAAERREQQRHAQLEAALSKLRQRHDALSAQHAATLAELAAARAEAAAARADAAEADRAGGDTRGALEAARAEVARLRKERQHAITLLQQKDEGINGLQAHLMALERELEALRAEQRAERAGWQRTEVERQATFKALHDENVRASLF
jgi:hypothetical protein